MYEILIIESTHDQRGMSVIPVSNWETMIAYVQQMHKDYTELLQVTYLEAYTIYVYENEKADPVYYSPPPTVFEPRKEVN